MARFYIYMKYLKLVFIKWIPLAVVVSLTAVLVFGAVQQAIRQTANSPQVQMAEDVADVYNSGMTEDFSVQHRWDIAKTLTPFIMIFDAEGRPTAGNALIDSKAPLPPIGVFDKAKITGENRFTWEPKPGVRIATVIVPYSVAGGGSGFVLVGRSLRETEHTVQRIAFDVLIGWIVMMVASFKAVFLTNLKHREKRKDVVDFDVEHFSEQVS